MTAESLNFCMVTTFYPPYNFGGDGIAIQRLARALVRRGHRVTVIHDVDAFNVLHRGPAPAAVVEPQGLTVYPLRSGLGALSPFLTQQLGRPIANGRKIREIIDGGAFDVIHFHNISLIGGPGVLSAGSGIKIYSAHEHWLVCASHVLWRHNREACAGKECFRCALHFKRPPQYWRYTGFLDRQLQHVDAFIAMSEFSRAKHLEFGFRGEMEVVPCFLPDESTKSSQETSTTPHPWPYFLAAGRLERIKGLQDVIPAFAAPGASDLLIAGEGDYGAELRQLAANLPRVKFLGRLDQATLAGYYRNALAVIAPTLGFETFGMTVIEAFQHATPVIARRIGPFPELLEAANAGFLFSTREELLEAMRQLEESPSLRAELGRRGQEAVQMRWCEAAVLPKYLQVVRKAAQKRGNDRVAEALRTANENQVIGAGVAVCR